MSTALKVVQKFFPTVQKVHDATRPLHVEVTATDSRTSRRKDHNHCALAVACKRKKHADGVIISVASAYVIKGNKATRYRLPESARREVVSFDRAGGFDPGEYTLAPPSPTNKLGAKNKHSGPSGRGPKVKHVTKNVRAHI